MRLASGEEALVARVLAKDGRVAFGFSFRLDATEARQMALHELGFNERPKLERLLGHPWEQAYLSGEAIPWDREPAFASLAWL